MKIILYTDNLSYQKGMEDFISMSFEDRKNILAKYDVNPLILEIEEFARGSTCVCYQIKTEGALYGQIIKQYYPQVLINSQEIRVDNGSVFINENADYDGVKGEYARFLNTTDESVRKIYRHYREQEINMFVNPRIALTSLGYVFICEKIGDTLQNFYNSLLNDFYTGKKKAKEFLTELLSKFFRTLLTIQRVQESDHLLLDVKPQNLCTVTGDMKEESWSVRVIDFGSSLSIKDFERIIKEPRSIRYRYLSSNQKYYSQNDFEDFSKRNDMEITEYAKWLDVKAALNIVLDCLICATRRYASLSCNTESIDFLTYPTIIQDFFTTYSISDSLFETYYIYSSFMNIYTKQNREQLIIKILKLLSIITNNIFFEKKEGAAQHQAVLFNTIFKKKDEELGFKKKSFKEFLDYCKRGNYSNLSIQDLYWRLLCGINL